MIIRKISQSAPVPSDPIPAVPTSHPTGPGTILKAMLARLGVRPAPGCKCNSRARHMDLQGPDWCQEHLEEIVGWLREEAVRSGLPFIPILARHLIRRAIRQARARDHTVFTATVKKVFTYGGIYNEDTGARV